MIITVYKDKDFKVHNAPDWLRCPGKIRVLVHIFLCNVGYRILLLCVLLKCAAVEDKKWEINACGSLYYDIQIT
ncbi:unnamed protein product [Trifolium pratense]|uniref:Uncharacterized protein n=1 Tax=Trifolium pratense TaxID=57577 RepID=A0ACB0JZD2_TRIPR|nr:unnamed protein product [Trifolium pratense]